MSKLWQRRRWVTLLNLIDHLPASSFFGEAIAEDDDLSDFVDDTGAVSRPRVSQWTPDHDVLVGIYDRLGDAIELTAAVHGSPTKVKPHPRPVTALDRRKSRRAADAHQRIVQRLLP